LVSAKKEIIAVYSENNKKPVYFMGNTHAELHIINTLPQKANYK
jgi:hypothetical protein